ncbi:terpenoid synthase [Gautieria morchelliformis]|nr:terpenoid synthase [Gautieria morchelliformis]
MMIPSHENQAGIYMPVGKLLETIVSKQVQSSKTPSVSRPASDSNLIVIPDILRSWPWSRCINPHYAICKEETTAWWETFNGFSARTLKAFPACDVALLGSSCYPLLNKDGCRIASDIMALMLVIDEHTDAADGKTARMQADIVMDAFRNPNSPRSADEWVGGEVARQFWLNVTKTATPSAQRRLFDGFLTYIYAVVQQAEDRSAGHIRDVESYFEVRRETSGTKPSFAIVEIHMNIPEEVMNHPVIVRLFGLAGDMVLIGNDLFSYNVEQARGDEGHNLVRVLMDQYNIDRQMAMDCIGKLHDDFVEQFLATWEKIPTFGGPVDQEIRTYLEGLARWIRGNESWSFECTRYFPKLGPQILLTRQGTLLPRSSILQPR